MVSFLKTGTTEACFQTSGNTPWSIDAKSCVMNSMVFAQIYRSFDTTVSMILPNILIEVASVMY